MDQNNDIKPGEADIKNYTDLEGMTTKKLAFGLWFVEHRRIFRYAIIVVLIIISGISWVYTIFNFAKYMFIGRQADNAMLASLNTPTNHDVVLASAPKELVFGTAQTLPSSSEGKNDFFVETDNNNPKYWCNFTYYFTAGGGTTQKQDTFILPGESKYLLALAQGIDSGGQSVEFHIENLSWHRVDAHAIPDYSAYKKERLNILTTNIKYAEDMTRSFSDKLNFNHLDFDVSNYTIYDYGKINFIIVMKSAENVVAVDRYSIDSIESSETKHIALVWPGVLPPVSEVTVMPELNIFRNDNFIR